MSHLIWCYMNRSDIPYSEHPPTSTNHVATTYQIVFEASRVAIGNAAAKRIGTTKFEGVTIHASDTGQKKRIRVYPS